MGAFSFTGLMGHDILTLDGRIAILLGDVRARLAAMEPDSVDCVVTSPPYWGLRDYGVDGQIGLERTLGEHLEVILDVFRLVRRVLKPAGTLWVNYGDCYANSPNGRSAADCKAAGTDDRTFRDKPFSTIGPIYDPSGGAKGGGVRGSNKGNINDRPAGRVCAGGYNVGTGAVCRSTAARLAREGRYRESCQAMTAFNRAGGKVMRGLVLRREWGDAQRLGELEVCLEGLR